MSTDQSDPFARPLAKRPAARSEHVRDTVDKRQKLTHAASENHPSQSAPPQKDAGISREYALIAQDVDVYEANEDDRFFGGGLSEEQAQALDFLEANDHQDAGPAVALDVAGLRKLAARFERAITKNQKMRARYVDEPEKFLDSEAELDVEIKALSVLSEYPTLFKEFADMNCIQSLVGLIGHENSDIACDTIQIIQDLTEEETNATDEEASALLEALISAQALEILTQNLDRLDEAVQAERDGIFRTMSIIENVVNIKPEIRRSLFTSAGIQKWLVQRMQKSDSVGPFSENKQYSAELLSVLIQDSPENANEAVRMEVVDLCLMTLAPYRRKDPEKGSTEEEFVENVFDILCTLVATIDGKDKFLVGEGLELMQRLLLDAKSYQTRYRALQVIEYACGSWSGGAICAQSVEIGLLRTLFSLFIKKSETNILKACLGTFVSFFRTLNEGEPERIRVINKFVENNFQKTRRLLDLRSSFQNKHSALIKRLDMDEARRPNMSPEDKVEYELTKYLDRLENGLDGIQLIDTILAWLFASDGSLKKFIQAEQQNVKLEDIKATLAEIMENLGVQQDQNQDQVDTDEPSEAKEEYEMLEALVYNLRD